MQAQHGGSSVQNESRTRQHVWPPKSGDQASPGGVLVPIYTRLLSSCWKIQLGPGASTAEADRASWSWTGGCSGAAELLNAPAQPGARESHPALPWEVSNRALLCHGKTIPIPSFQALLELGSPSATALLCSSKRCTTGELPAPQDLYGDPLPCPSPWCSRDPAWGQRPSQVLWEDWAGGGGPHSCLPPRSPFFPRSSCGLQARSWLMQLGGFCPQRASRPGPAPPALPARTAGGSRGWGHPSFPQGPGGFSSPQLAGHRLQPISSEE